MSKKRLNHMEEKLNQFNEKKKNMTTAHALNEEIQSGKNEKSIIDNIKKKKKVEYTHTRNTFLIRNDLLKRLNNLSKHRRGFKTEFINYVVEQGLDDLENSIDS